MKISKPQLSHIEEIVTLKEVLYGFEEEKGTVEFLLFQNEVFHNSDISNIEFKECKFISCKFIDCDFSKSSFVDIIFQSCDFSNSDFTKSSIHKTAFIDCKLMGSVIVDSHIRNVSFEQCLCRYINMSQSNINNTILSNSSFENAAFSECKLAVELNECIFNGANFFRTYLKGIDFSKCNIDNIMLGGEELKGAIVNSFQAIELSKLLGIIVKQ